MNQIYEEIISEMDQNELLEEYKELLIFRHRESERGQVTPSIIRQIKIVEDEIERQIKS